MTPTSDHPNWFPALAAASAGSLGVALLLTVLFPERIVDPGGLRLHVLAVLAVVALVLVLTQHLRRPWRAGLHTAGVIALIGFLFGAVEGMQHMVVPGWKDAALIAFESQFTGEELSHILERITTPLLTEWLMAAYVIYVPLLPFTAWMAYRSGGERKLHAYLFSLLSVNLLCDAGFVLYPIASQLFFDPGQYTVPLTGGFFTGCAEWIRTTQHFPGGSFPSPHNAAGAVILVFLWRSHRGWAAVMTPFLLSIPMATVYGRFHYVSDAIVGIALAAGVLHLVLQFRRAPDAVRNDGTDRIARGAKGLADRRCPRLTPHPQIHRTSSGGMS